jgi:hypothetical protein
MSKASTSNQPGLWRRQEVSRSAESAIRWGVLGVGNKVGVYGVREQTTGPRHRRVGRMSTASTSHPKVQGVSAGPRHRLAAEGSRCQQTNGSANNQPVDGFGGRGRRHQRAIARSRRRQAWRRQSRVHRQVSGMSTMSTSKRKVQGVSADPRRR